MLKTWLRKSNDCLKAAEEKSLEHEKKAQEVGSAWDEALAQALSLKEEVDFLKSATHRESIITNFRGSEAYTVEVEARAASYLDKGATHMVQQLHHLIPDKKFWAEAFDNGFDASSGLVPES